MLTVRPATTQDLDAILRLVSQGFNIPSSAHARMRNELRLDLFRVAEEGGRVLGCARTIPFGHFYGGRMVPAAGIASVAVSADARGKRVGATLMRETLAEMRGAGYPISSLYPATVPIYRSVGYGWGSVRTRWQAKLAMLPRRPADGADVEELTDDHLDEVNAVYERIAAGTGGLVARDADWWSKRVLNGAPDESARYRYLVREAGEITGWIVYSLESQRDTWRFKLGARDLFWTTGSAGRTLLSLAALHRSTGEDIQWIGPPIEPIEDLTEDHTIELGGSFRTMLRLLDVPGAIEARGYSPVVDTSVSIGIRDPQFPENEGPWRIHVEGGTAKVAPSDEAEIIADADAFSPVWSGLHRARTAARVGGLEATSDDALTRLDAIFGAPTPWIADFY